MRTVLAPAAGDIVTLVDLSEEGGDILGVVLQVAVEGNDHLPLRFVETSRESGGLPEVPAEANDFEASVGLTQIRQEVETAIGGRVIHKDNFVRFPKLFEDFGQFVVERQDGRLFVVDGNNHREHIAYFL